MSSPCSLYFLPMGSLGSQNKYIREPGRGSITFSDRLGSQTRMTFVIVGFRGEIIHATSPEESCGVCRLLLCPPTKLLKEHQQAAPKYCQVHKILVSLFSSHLWKTRNANSTGLMILRGELNTVCLTNMMKYPESASLAL